MPSVACQRCGKVDPSLRLAVFPWVVSIVIMSYKRAAVGIFCSGCRSSEKWKYLGVSALLGWWGIPWGIFWTLEALANDAAGGKLPEEQNAGLLAVLGQELLESGDVIGARDSWTASLSFKNDARDERALVMLNAGTASPRRVPTATPAEATTPMSSGYSEPTQAQDVRPGDVIQVVRASPVRSSPDPASPVIESSTLGTSHVVLSRKAGWTQVRLGAGRSGWLTDSDIAKANS